MSEEHDEQRELHQRLRDVGTSSEFNSDDCRLYIDGYGVVMAVVHNSLV